MTEKYGMSISEMEKVLEGYEDEEVNDDGELEDLKD